MHSITLLQKNYNIKIITGKDWEYGMGKAKMTIEISVILTHLQAKNQVELPMANSIPVIAACLFISLNA